MTRTIRLCTWNIEFGLQLKTICHALQTCADFASIDLLALQEASVHNSREDAQVMAASLGATYDYFQLAAQQVVGRVQANALVWNTERVLVRDKSSVKLPHMNQLQSGRVERTLLRALPPQQRISLVIDAHMQQETVRIYVAHLDVVGYQHKRQQFERILNDAQTRSPADLTLIAGDLNTFKLIRSRPHWGQLDAAATAAGFKDLTSEIRWTHAVPQLRIKQKLDAIFMRYAHPIRYRSWSLDIAGSDHIPVFAEIQWGSLEQP